MTTVTVRSKAGEMEQITNESFLAWKRRVGKYAGFVVKLSQDDERLVCARGEMQRLPPGSFEADLVRKCAVADPLLKKKLRGSDVWKGV